MQQWNVTQSRENVTLRDNEYETVWMKHIHRRDFIQTESCLWILIFFFYIEIEFHTIPSNTERKKWKKCTDLLVHLKKIGWIWFFIGIRLNKTLKPFKYLTF